jgi:hypothetical protein
MVRMLSIVSSRLPSMPKGEIVGIFITGRHKAEYLFVIDGKLSPMMVNKRKWKD